MTGDRGGREWGRKAARYGRLGIRGGTDRARSAEASILWVNAATVNAQCDSASFLIVAHHETISKSLFATKMVPRNRPISRPAPAQSTASSQNRTTGSMPRFLAVPLLICATSSLVVVRASRTRPRSEPHCKRQIHPQPNEFPSPARRSCRPVCKAAAGARGHRAPPKPCALSAHAPLGRNSRQNPGSVREAGGRQRP